MSAGEKSYMNMTNVQSAIIFLTFMYYWWIVTIEYYLSESLSNG